MVNYSEIFGWRQLSKVNECMSVCFNDDRVCKATCNHVCKATCNHVAKLHVIMFARLHVIMFARLHVIMLLCKATCNHVAKLRGAKLYQKNVTLLVSRLGLMIAAFVATLNIIKHFSCKR